MAALTTRNSRGSIEPLRPEDLRQIHPGWRSRLNLQEIRECLQRAPGRSVWDAQTGEYAIVNRWRNRTDVLQIADLASIRDPEALAIAVVGLSWINAAFHLF